MMKYKKNCNKKLFFVLQKYNIQFSSDVNQDNKNLQFKIYNIYIVR